MQHGSRNYRYTNKITIRDNFQVVFHVGIDAQHLVNYDHRKVNKLVKYEILTHFQFNISLLLKIERKQGGRKWEQIMSKNREGSLQIWILDRYGCKPDKPHTLINIKIIIVLLRWVGGGKVGLSSCVYTADRSPINNNSDTDKGQIIISLSSSDDDSIACLSKKLRLTVSHQPTRYY